MSQALRVHVDSSKIRTRYDQKYYYKRNFHFKYFFDLSAAVGT